MNRQKRLKHIDGDGDGRKSKEYGANNPFRKIKFSKKNKNSDFRFKNRKNQKFGFLCACVCVKDEKFVLFPDALCCKIPNDAV